MVDHIIHTIRIEDPRITHVEQDGEEFVVVSNLSNGATYAAEQSCISWRTLRIDETFCKINFSYYEENDTKIITKVHEFQIYSKETIRCQKCQKKLREELSKDYKWKEEYCSDCIKIVEQERAEEARNARKLAKMVKQWEKVGKQEQERVEEQEMIYCSDGCGKSKPRIDERGNKLNASHSWSCGCQTEKLSEIKCRSCRKVLTQIEEKECYGRAYKEVIKNKEAQICFLCDSCRSKQKVAENVTERRTSSTITTEIGKERKREAENLTIREIETLAPISLERTDKVDRLEKEIEQLREQLAELSQKVRELVLDKQQREEQEQEKKTAQILTRPKDFYQ